MQSDWLNYHHLLYFWTAAREGSVSKAAAQLRLAQPTVSAQIRALERALGEPLFLREGRRLALTDAGRIVHRYADDIFGLGREMRHALAGHAPSRPQVLNVGVGDAVPKLIVYRMLRPALRGRTFRLMCREGAQQALLADLATHALDIVIADAPAAAQAGIKVFSHLLGESDTAFFAPAKLAARLRRRFPDSIDGAPMLAPSSGAMRRELDAWFDGIGVRPDIIGEFDDSALMKTFSHGAQALFPAPAAIAGDVARAYRVRQIGRTHEVREKYYVLSAERRIKHPAVVALTTAARSELFS